eukprot:2860909-Ditylum_brightwellii.AAC.1
MDGTLKHNLPLAFTILPHNPPSLAGSTKALSHKALNHGSIYACLLGVCKSWSVEEGNGVKKNGRTGTGESGGQWWCRGGVFLQCG